MKKQSFNNQGENQNMETLINIREASKWASQYLDRQVTTSNISYLIQYGRIKKCGNHVNGLPPKTAPQ